MYFGLQIPLGFAQCHRLMGEAFFQFGLGLPQRRFQIFSHSDVSKSNYHAVDPVFLRTVSRAGAPAHLAFLALVVVNLVNGFQALGTLLAVGLMILPAGIARFWSRDITGMICIAVVSAVVSGYAGLVLSFQTKVPSGPAIILVATLLYMVSVLFGSVGGVIRQMFPGRHLEA